MSLAVSMVATYAPYVFALPFMGSAAWKWSEVAAFLMMPGMLPALAVRGALSVVVAILGTLIVLGVGTLISMRGSKVLCVVAQLFLNSVNLAVLFLMAPH